MMRPWTLMTTATRPVRRERAAGSYRSSLGTGIRPLEPLVFGRALPGFEADAAEESARLGSSQ